MSETTTKRPYGWKRQLPKTHPQYELHEKQRKAFLKQDADAAAAEAEPAKDKGKKK